MENKPKNVTDHLANERTFLAWIRTAIAVMGFGFVVVKFSLFVRQFTLLVDAKDVQHHQGFSGIIGISLVLIGAVMVVFSYYNYKRIQKEINRADYQSGSPFSLVITLAMLVVGILLSIYLIKSL